MVLLIVCMTSPIPKKCSFPTLKLFFAIFSKNIAFFEKILLDEKIKTVTFIFVSRRPLPIKRNLSLRNVFDHFLGKYSFFFSNCSIIKYLVHNL